jgi:hypothetical protein
MRSATSAKGGPEKRDGILLPERPEGSSAQKNPVPFFGLAGTEQGIPIDEEAIP